MTIPALAGVVDPVILEAASLADAGVIDAETIPCRWCEVPLALHVGAGHDHKVPPAYALALAALASQDRDVLEDVADYLAARYRPSGKGGPRVSDAGPSGTRLDVAEAYLRAKNSLVDLNKSLKENGRSFSLSTAKGRENRAAMYDSIRAAEQAAQAKFEETGSVKEANKVYDQYIRNLRDTLKKAGLTKKQIDALLKVAERPDYGIEPKAPGNSDGNKGWARADITAREGRADLADRLSLNEATLDLKTEAGRENLGSILDALDQAQAAAQAKFDQTKSTKQATAVYNAQLAELRAVLKAAGYDAKTIDRLFTDYGRITLQTNAIGGVYGPGGLTTPSVFAGGRTMYAFAEASTGGEAFLPRYGDQVRGEQILAIGAGWYGGQYVPAGQAGGSSTTIYNSLTVQPLTYQPTMAELIGYQRQIDVQSRVGRPH